MKQCCTCKEIKPFEEFGKRSNGKPQSKCKLCQRVYVKKHYINNKQKYINKAYLHTKKKRDENMEKIIKIKSAPCTDCGMSYPHYVMDFDHLERSDKENCVSWLCFNSSWDKVVEEIKKCELVCSNCHRERTYRRSTSQDKGKKKTMIPETFGPGLYAQICEGITKTLSNRGYDPQEYMISNHPFGVQRKDGSPLSDDEVIDFMIIVTGEIDATGDAYDVYVKFTE